MPGKPVGWDQKSPPERGWCYAFLLHVYPTQMEQKLHLEVINPNKSNLHNVSVTVHDATGTSSREKDLAMFAMQSVVLPIIYPVYSGKIGSTGLSYDYPSKFLELDDIFEITITPEDGDAVKETLVFSHMKQCMSSVIRIKDGKVLLSRVIPQIDMFTGQYDPEWKSCN